MSPVTFNLLLAVGGGAVVPAVVGAVAAHLIRQQDPGIFAQVKEDLFTTSKPVLRQELRRDDRVSA